MDLVRWRYEVRLSGWRALLGPPVALGALTAFAALISFSAPREINPIMSFGLDLLPLVAGIAAASAVSGDGLLELQLSLPASFRVTVLHRLAVALGWPLLITLLGTLALSVTERLVWPVPSTGYATLDQLIWLAPSLWLAGWGAAITLGLRNVAAASGVVGLLWMLELVAAGLFDDSPWGRLVWLFFPYADGLDGTWYLNRAILIVSALAMLAIAVWLLGRSEHLLGGEW